MPRWATIHQQAQSHRHPQNTHVLRADGLIVRRPQHVTFAV
jgi:hypothetical protein